MATTDKELAEQLYKELVGNRIEPLIVKYDIISGDFEYHPYRHAFVANIETELTDVLFDNIVFYAFEDSEIASEYRKKRLDELRRAVRVAYNRPHTERINDGLLGEYCLRSIKSDLKKVFCENILQDKWLFFRTTNAVMTFK